MTKKKILYFMGVEWNWIIQRPQILALYLQRYYEVTVVCPKQLLHNNNHTNASPERLIELLQLPFQEKNRFIGRIAWIWHTDQLKYISSYDMIWIGYPIFGRYIPDDYRGKVIYDCMDNMTALYPDQRPESVRYVEEQERKLIRRANVVFASSQKLKEKMEKMCPNKKVIVVRNGYSNITIREPASPQVKEEYHLGYIGTIGEWFDRDAIFNSLDENKRVYYELIGPTNRHERIRHDRVHYEGTVEHRLLENYVNRMDALIMPFLPNDIVLYVDPVKLYEYIAWGKCIICSWYPEIDRFKDYVYFYQGQGEYLQLIKELSEHGFPVKYSGKQQRFFLRQNTWEERGKAVIKVLEREMKP